MSSYIDKSDPRVYDTKNYDMNLFEYFGCHNHQGTELDEYFKNVFPIENENFESVMAETYKSSQRINQFLL